MEERREVTARVKIRIKDNEIIVKSKNTFSIIEELTIISSAITMLGGQRHDELDSYEWLYFDGEDQNICLAYNIDTCELQISINDIPKNLELGVLEYAKQIVLNDLLGS